MTFGKLQTIDVSRRNLLKGGVMGLGYAVLGASGVARAAESIVVAHPGGPYEQAFKVAFADPFSKETGIAVNLVVHPYLPGMQVVSQIRAGTYQWDVVSLSEQDAILLHDLDMVEPLDYSGPDVGQLIPSATRMPGWMVIDIYSQAFAYRTDTFPNEAPSSWADFWNVEKFPGRRGLVREAEVMEQALLADGVLPADLFPLDMDRALRKLDEIKPHITTWWTSGAQTSQFLVTGELDLCSCYNGRAQVAIDEGAPVRIVWNQASLIEHGWSVPKGGPKTELARQFVKFCARADRQAAYTDYLPYGPTNPKSYDFISPEIAAKLPTEPGRVDLTYKGDAAWWAANKEEAHERFEAWLMG